MLAMQCQMSLLFGPSVGTDTLFTCFPATLTTDNKELLLKCRVALRLGMSIFEQGTDEAASSTRFAALKETIWLEQIAAECQQ